MSRRAVFDYRVKISDGIAILGEYCLKNNILCSMIDHPIIYKGIDLEDFINKLQLMYEDGLLYQENIDYLKEIGMVFSKEYISSEKIYDILLNYVKDNKTTLSNVSSLVVYDGYKVARLITSIQKRKDKNLLGLELEKKFISLGLNFRCNNMNKLILLIKEYMIVNHKSYASINDRTTYKGYAIGISLKYARCMYLDGKLNKEYEMELRMLGESFSKRVQAVSMGFSLVKECMLKNLLLLDEITGHLDYKNYDIGLFMDSIRKRKRANKLSLEVLKKLEDLQKISDTLKTIEQNNMVNFSEDNYNKVNNKL